MHKKLILNTVLAISLLSSMVLTTGTSFAAGSASLTLSPASGSYSNGSSFSVTVSENGTTVNAVTVDLVYDASKLQLIGENCTGAFSSSAGQSGSTISCFVPGGTAAVSGSQAAVSASFKAIAGSDTTAVTFGSDSIIASNGANVWNGAAAGGTYSLTTPAVTTPTAPTTPSTPTTTPTSGTTTTNGTGSSTATSTTSTGTVNGSSTTTPSTPTTTNPSTTKTTTPTTSKSASKNSKSNNSRNNHNNRWFHNSAFTSSTALLLFLVGAGLYWTLRRRTPVVVPVTYKVGKKATGVADAKPTTHKTTAKKASNSKSTAKTKQTTTKNKKA